MIPSQGPIITKSDIKNISKAVNDGWYSNYQKYITNLKIDLKLLLEKNTQLQQVVAQEHYTLH